MSFFIRKNQLNGVKLDKRKKLPKFEKKDSEVISSDEELVEGNQDQSAPSSEDENETAQEKKIRLAKTYLEEIKREEKRRLEREEDAVSNEVIAKRLKEDYLKQSGRFKSSVADKYIGADVENQTILKCRDHRSSITCLCISSDNKYIYSGSKDSSIVKWSISDRKRCGSIPHKKSSDTTPGHTKRILSIAISTDNKFLAVGDESKDIQIWNPENLNHINTLKGHQGPVTGLVFKKETHILYSCSRDRSVKVWSLDEMAYVETLFGHQDGITAVDALYKDRAITAGGRDNTLRFWKITEESQLIFNGHNGSIDTVRLINEEHFVSGGDDGELCVWSIMKKKPLCSAKTAHGRNPTNQEPYWITSVASLQNTDLLASGSQDGFVNLWKLGDNFRTMELLHKIPIQGFVNAMCFTSDGKNLIVALGQEHRFGRWDVVKSAKNSIAVIPLKRND